MVRIPARDPFGDKAFVKYDMWTDLPFSIKPSRVGTYDVFQWNSMEAILGQFYGASGRTSWPPGIMLYANVYQQYRISAISLSVIFLLEGGSTTDTVAGEAMTAVPTPMASIAFEGYPDGAEAQVQGNINTVTYWSPRAIQQQRWKVNKYMTQVGSTGAKVTCKRYMTAKALWPDHVTLMEQNQSAIAQVATSPATPPIPEYGIPKAFLYCGYGVTNLNGIPNPTTSQTNFTVRVKARIYVEYWDKVVNSYIAGLSI